MAASTALRLCIVLLWISIPCQVIASDFFTSTIPEPVQDWVNSQDVFLGFSDRLLLPLFLFLMMWFIISSIGLFCLHRWAAWVFLAYWLLGALVIMLSGPMLENGVYNMFGALEDLAFGMVIALAFFSDALQKKPTETS